MTTKTALDHASDILRDCDTNSPLYQIAETFIKERDDIVDQCERDEDGEIKSPHLLDEKLNQIEDAFMQSINSI